jgi:DNA-binding MarR family transcriptional regulator
VIYQHHSQAIEAALRAAGFNDIAPSAGNVFPFIRPEGITISALAQLAGVRKQTMTQAVEQLERSGYVERRDNPDDRRSRLVFLTERGRSVTPVTHAAAAAVEQQWAGLIGTDELEHLRQQLRILLHRIRG